jgi:hypothetical protein
MGFHRKSEPSVKPAGRWFSLRAKAASLTCFEDWHDLATQDGTFGDSQRHDPIPGNNPSRGLSTGGELSETVATG